MEQREYNCKACNASDSADNMVLCDNQNCGSRFHYGCVGVNSFIAHQPWKCASCTHEEADHQPGTSNDAPNALPTEKPLATSQRSTSSKPSATRQLQLELRKLEEERQLEQERQKREQEYLNKKYRILSLIENGQSDSEDDDSHSSESAIMRTNTWIADLNQRSKRAEEEAGVNPTNRVPIATTAANTMQPTDALENTLLPQTQQVQMQLPNRHNHSPYATVNSTVASVGNQFANVQQQQHIQAPRGIQQHQQPHPPDQLSDYRQQVQSNRQLQDFPSPTMRFEPDNRVLTRNQLVARHSFSKELHNFSGDPDEWPLFISSFERSSELCGFSSDENLIRLQRALKGKALESVRSMLTQPNCVPRVISTLRMLYGRPEIIIHTLLKKVQATPPPRADKLETIVSFAIAVQNLCATIEACHLGTHLNNPTLLQELVDKLPPAIRLNWALHRQTLPDAPCTLSHFSSWLYQMAVAANSVVIPSLSDKPTSRNTKEKGFLNAHYAEVKENDNYDPGETKRKCPICGGRCPSVPKCKEFEQLSHCSKWAVVRERRLCRCCLSNHGRQRCTTASICGKNKCIFKHHRMLHNDKKDKPQQKEIMHQHGIQGISAHHNDRYYSQPESVLFRVIPVTLYGNNSAVNVLAFLDEGSSLTLLDEDVAKELNVNGLACPIRLKWTGNQHRYEDKSEVMDLKISGSHPHSKQYILGKVHTVRSLQLPRQSRDYQKLKEKYSHLRGLPVSSFASQRPQLLIGIDNWKFGLPLKFREGIADEPAATKTRLGWAVHGCCNNTLQEAKVDHTCNVHTCECEQCHDEELTELVKQFICNDNLEFSRPVNTLLPVEEKRALSLLEELTLRKGNRYETGLLWKCDNTELPDSFPMALKRFENLQRRMKHNPELARALQIKMKEYLAKGYARKLTPQEADRRSQRTWYLPTFPVTNPNKPGKIRIVWDAAAKVRGISLNSVLIKGPDQLVSLVSVLYKFREKAIAVCADIMEMFHQVKIRTEDQDSQRFLWSDRLDQYPDTLVMTVMTFGATCSPASAQYIKNENAKQFTEMYPAAVGAILNNHYVDDLLASVDTAQEAVQLAENIRFIHRQGGFRIRNWISNSAKVVEALRSNNPDELNLNMDAESATEKVLGMWWSTSTDTFLFKPSKRHKTTGIVLGHRRPTKREVLRVLMSVFDPLGLIAHFLMYLKVLLQEIWRSGIGWDEDIEEQQYGKWLHWVRVLPTIGDIQIPRCYTTTRNREEGEMQLHIFVDASENGYAAVAYTRYSNEDEAEISLIGAKTRVAPLKNLSIPRMELQAALLGARLSKSIIQSHSIVFTRKVFWSDSKNVLSWLRSDHRRYKQFVAFRVSEIISHSEVSEWRWIPSKLNVADDATKWSKNPDFSSSSRWFRGPAFLLSPTEMWPVVKEPPVVTQEEIKTQFVGAHFKHHQGLLEWARFSDWTKLLRTVARFIRCASRWIARVKPRMIEDEAKTPVEPQARKHAPDAIGPLTQTELQFAERLLLKEALLDAYEDEIHQLSKYQTVSKSSSIYKLCPFLDENQIIRLNGRIDLSNDASDSLKRPILLPGSHHITKLIVLECHYRYKHLNHETVLNEIRQRFHVASLRRIINSVRRSCQVCKNSMAQPQPPIMAQHPPARLASFSRPFSFVGVDYFRPLTVTVLRRAVKRWGVLLTCLTTRAIHIEIAHSLSTDSCILALLNFMAGRGIPLELHSDNGTNFRGADRELREAYERVNKEKLMETFTSTLTKWVFIPPGSPHMGGSWERLVRSVKIILEKTLHTRNPSDELLQSSLIEVENIINSRPLTYIPISDEKEDALTPNHFFLGSSSGLKPLAKFCDDRTVVRKNYLASQQFADMFWKRWVNEYLPTITRRTKWFTPVRPIEVGSIVLIVDPNHPRNLWPKGRVIATRRSKDGQVRSATVLTNSGTFERPAVKLAVLDVSGSDVVKPTVPLAIPGGSVNNAA